MLLAGVLTIFIWLYLLFARGQFWRIRTAVAASGPPARIAIIIPARNEADVIARAIGSLLQQTGGHSLHIFLVDDASSDNTAQAALAAAAAQQQPDKLTVVHGAPLPLGWSGKLWAMEQGVER